MKQTYKQLLVYQRHYYADYNTLKYKIMITMYMITILRDRVDAWKKITIIELLARYQKEIF